MDGSMGSCAERHFFHFGEVAPALFGRHGLADGQEMLEHLGLALGAQGGHFIQFGLRLGGDIGAAGQEAASSSAFFAAICAQISPHFGVACVQFPDARHFGVVQMKFRPQPVQIIGRVGAADHGGVPGGQIEPAKIAVPSASAPIRMTSGRFMVQRKTCGATEAT